MNKNKVIALTASFFLFVLAFSIIAYAAGTSTGGLSNSTNRSMQNKSDDRSISANMSKGKNCESGITRLERIQCRLDQRGIALNVTEETCRNLPNSNACRSLYAKVLSCYNFNGKQKDQCFKRIAGFIKSKSNEENNKTALRSYMVFLLYDLQEKIEKANAEGSVNSTSAAEAIGLIVEIKQGILLGSTKAEIRPKIQELKLMLRDMDIFKSADSGGILNASNLSAPPAIPLGGRGGGGGGSGSIPLSNPIISNSPVEPYGSNK